MSQYKKCNRDHEPLIGAWAITIAALISIIFAGGFLYGVIGIARWMGWLPW